MRWTVTAFALSGLLALNAVALAQSESDDATRSAARTLGKEGLSAYDAGDYPAAAQKLARAYAAVRVPTLGLWLARALAKTGKLVEASERYGEVTRLEISKLSNVEVQTEAQAKAKRERAELLPRIPTVRIQIEGADPDAVQITIDGTPVPSELLVVPRSVNPGQRTIEGKRGEEVVRKSVSVEEGQKEQVVLTFHGRQGAATLAKKKSPTATETPGPKEASAGWPTLTWVGFIAGGAGVLAGSVTGVLSLSATSRAREYCVNDNCAPPANDDIDSAKTMGTVSTVSFGVGIVGIGVGLAALLTSSPDSDARTDTAPNQTSLAPIVSPDYVGLGGTF